MAGKEGGVSIQSMPERLKTRQTSTGTSTNSAGTSMKVMLAGGMAGAFSKTCTAPFGRMTILYQLGMLDEHRSSIVGGMRHIVASQGFFSLWRGHTATLLHRIPYSAVNFAVFENTKVFLSPFLKSRSEGGSYATETARYLIAGGAGGSVGCAVAYPLDLVKTKMAGDLAHVSPRRGALIRCFSTILRQEGVRGLYKGIGATLTQVTPALAINFTAYEFSKSFMSAILRRQSQQEGSSSWVSWPTYFQQPQNSNHGAEGVTTTTGIRSPALIIPAAASGAEKVLNSSSNESCQRVDGAAHSAHAEAAHSSNPPLQGINRIAQSTEDDSIEGRSNRGGAVPAVGAVTRTTPPQLGATARPREQGGQLSVYDRALVSLVAGTVAGVVSSTSTFPLDVVRRRLQIAPSSTSYMSMVQSMYGEGGVGAFYRGLLTEYLKVIPGVAIAFCSYEVMKSFLFQ